MIHNVEGSIMYKFQNKLKQCMTRILEWMKNKNTNSRVQIERIKMQMEVMQEMGNQRDWNT